MLQILKNEYLTKGYQNRLLINFEKTIEKKVSEYIDSVLSKRKKKRMLKLDIG